MFTRYIMSPSKPLSEMDFATLETVISLITLDNKHLCGDMNASKVISEPFHGRRSYARRAFSKQERLFK